MDTENEQDIGEKEPNVGEKRITIRLPQDVYSWLGDVADEEMRSINAQLVMILNQARNLRKQTPSGSGGARIGRMPRRHNSSAKQTP